jgi:quercetin dioxygenase-like cupin family protein
MDEQQSPQYDRLRPAPSERFAGSSHLFDLQRALAALRSESHPGRDGHRQVTIFHRAPISHVLFAFDEGGTLPSHSARGSVTIHILEGEFVLRVDGSDHEMRAGQLLVLKPDVVHDVRALEQGAMLLTVVMDNG